MSDWKQKFKGGLTDEEVKKYLRFLIIPFVIIILILVIVLTDKSSKQEQIDTNSLKNAKQTSKTGDVISGYEDYDLLKDEIPEIQTLMESYFKARLDCDPAALEKLFGKEAGDDTASMEEDLKLAAEYIENYENITCYTKKGLEEDSYLVYVEYDIKFQLTDTLAPGLLWCYVKKDAQGNYYIVEEPNQEEASYIAYAEQADDVRDLASQVNTRLEEAVASDSKLASIYEILKQGASEPEAASPAEAETSQDETAGTENQTSSAAESEAAQ